MEDETENVLRNPFPSPPSHYTRYTSQNLKLLALLQERASSQGEETPNQHELLSDQKDVPDWSLLQLEKPRVDWILEEPDPYYNVYGQTWFVKEKLASIADAGIAQLYPTDPSVDRRPALLSILKSLLVTYSNLITSLLRPPPAHDGVVPEWQRQAEWINDLCQNLLAAANDFRPMQARCNLEIMMQSQLDLRKEETKAIHLKCDELEAKLEQLRSSALELSMDTFKSNLSETRRASLQSESEDTNSSLTQNDVLQWAEEI